MSDTTRLLVEMFPGVFVGITIPTRYLAWSDDRPGQPEFLPFWKVNPDVKMEVE
jgi:hypothetical protein